MIAASSAARWPPLWEEFYCDWRQLWFDRHVEPPSWVLGDEAIAAGAMGNAFASTVSPSGTNLVLFVDKARWRRHVHCVRSGKRATEESGFMALT